MEIKGPIKEELTPEAILKRITEYDIYKYYFGDFSLNVVTNNHLRGDRNPSFIIGNKGGPIRHFDFADEFWRGDCFDFVKQKHGYSNFFDALKRIDIDFGLGLTHGSEKKDYKQITSSYKQPEVVKKDSLIQVTVRKFTKEELAYWNQYHQNIEDLRENNVYSIKALFLNKKKINLSPLELRFGYYYDGHWKIYRPFANKKSKWFPNNVPITAMDGKENIINCDTAFINKSKKDMMVVKKVYPCVCAVQNEGPACFSEENVKFLKSNSKRQILAFDSDQPGVKSSLQITKLYDFGYCNVPKQFLEEGIKDFAELGKIHGLKAIEQVLKQKNII